MSTSKRVTIIGAGFSGLTSAFYLERAGYQVEIFEASQRAGGLIATLKTPNGLIETAANGLINSALVEELFSSLNVPLIGTKRSARRRFIFRGGRAHRWPLGVVASIRVSVFLFRLIFDRRAVMPGDDESISKWGERTLGVEASQFLVNTALQGIYAGDPSRMSASLILGRFFKRSPKPASPKIRGSVTPPQGMQQLIDGLEAHLRRRGVMITYSSHFEISMRTGQQPVIVATNPRSAADIVQSVSPRKSELLRHIEMSSVITTTAFFDRTDASTEGFGILFAPVERTRALGVLKNNFIFENRATTQFSETWIQGGALANPDLNTQTDEQVIDGIVNERSTAFHLSERPTSAVTTRWPQGIPHYTLDLQKMIPDLKSSEQNIFLMGNYLGDLGLAKILERASRLPDRLAKEAKW